ncbi:MAG TPA: hypothetical protein VFS21_07285 [Roseiflexaceae bacterium]|nr:hypothetical protein [Roseiflexaceae bacterium]
MIDRKRLVQELVAGQHPLLLLVLAHWTQYSSRTSIELAAALSDAQLVELVDRGIITAPIAEAPQPEVGLLPAAPSPFPGLAVAMAEARAMITPWQRSVQPGDAIVVGGQDGLLIYGVVEADPGCPADYVYGPRWCSSAYPPGEGGDNHRSQILMRLRRDELARAEAERWPETLDELFRLIWPLRGAAAA